MKRATKTIVLLYLVPAVMVLAACHGGSSGASAVNSNPDAQDSTSLGGGSSPDTADTLTPLPKDAASTALQNAAIAYEPRLVNATTDWQRAVLLRNLVYSHTTVGSGPSITWPLTVAELDVVLNGDSPQLCGGMSEVYIGLLQAFGLHSHILNLLADSALYLSGTGLDTHVSVEVYLNGRWVVQDPTFNVHWQIYGQPLDIAGLRNAFLYGFQPEPETDGVPTLPGRALSDYYMPFGPLTANVEVGDLNMLGDYDYMRVADYPDGASPFQKFGASPLGVDVNDGPPELVTDPYDGSPLYTAIHPYTGLTLLYQENFTDGLPQGWVAMPGTTLLGATDNGLRVLTNTDPLNYQLVSPVLNLGSGWVRWIVGGSAVRGGIGLYVLDMSSQQFVSSSSFVAKQWELNPAGVAYVDFYLPQSDPVELIMANYHSHPASSDWHISSVSVGQIQ